GLHEGPPGREVDARHPDARADGGWTGRGGARGGGARHRARTRFRGQGRPMSMIDLSIDRDLEARLGQVRRLGREHLRPLGIEADSRREPVPPDHPFFALAWRMGLGQPLGVEERPASGPRSGARRGVVLAEEMSYWDRGMSVAMPGLGLGGPPLLRMGTHEHKMGLIAYESSSFTLRDCRVPAANLLGGERYYAERAGFKGAMRSFNATRPAIAAMAVGIARAAYDAARDFARTHYALDRPIP